MATTDRSEPVRRTTLLAAAVLVAAVVASVLGTATAMTTDAASSDLVDVLAGRPDPDAPGAEGHLAWALRLVGDDPPSAEGVEARTSASFQEAVPPEEILGLSEELEALAPFTYRGMRRPDDARAEAVLETPDSTDLLLTVAEDPDDPARIGGLLITPEQQASGPFTSLEVAGVLVGGWSLLAAVAVRRRCRGATTRRQPSRAASSPERRARRVDVLLAAAGLLWLAQLGEASALPVLLTSALVAGPLALALLAHAVLAETSSRVGGHGDAARASARGRDAQGPPTRATAVVTVVAYGAAVVSWSHLVAIDTGSVGLAEHLLAPVTTDPGLASVLLGARAVAGGLAAAAGLVLLLVRRRPAPGDRPGAALAGTLPLAGLPRAVSIRTWTSTSAVVLATTVLGLAVTYGIIGGYELSLSPWLSLGVTALAAGSAGDALRDRAAPNGSNGLASLVADLGELPEREDLEASLARALDDPALRLAYFDRREARYVDAGGAAVDLDDIADERVVTRLAAGDQPLGAVVHDRGLLEQPGRVEAACTAVRLALDNERLQAVVLARLAEVRASRVRIVEAEEQARRRIERDLHDGAQQRLLGVVVHLRLLGGRVANADPEGGAQLERLVDELGGALDELRELARGLHPSILDHGLVPAVQSLAETSAVPVEVRATGFDDRRRGDPPLRDEDVTAGPATTARGRNGARRDRNAVDRGAAAEAAAHFVVREAITNATRHAGADVVRVLLERGPDTLSVEVRDDGRGGATCRAGRGLQGLTDRVNALGGTLELDSPPAAGTRLRVRIPL